MSIPNTTDNEPRSEPCVLVADNDPGVMLILIQALARAGFRRVETAADGALALARLQRGGVDLLVCDLDMPGLSGEELLAELDGWNDPPPVVVVSAFLDSVGARGLARSRALSGTLAKPFDLDEFGRVVRGALAGEQAAAAEPEGGLF